MAKEYANLFPLEGPRNFTQVWILGLKRNHLATLLGSTNTKEEYFCSFAREQGDQMGG
jgi:hypothetical protein